MIFFSVTTTGQSVNTYHTTLELGRLAVKDIDRLDAVFDHSDRSANQSISKALPHRKQWVSLAH